MNSWSKHWRWPTTRLKTTKRKAARVVKKTKPSLLLEVVVVEEELIAVVDVVLAVEEDQIKAEVAVLVAVKVAPARNMKADTSIAMNKSTKCVIDRTWAKRPPSENQRGGTAQKRG
ncbi:unnamed protein product [Phytophthora fragariaefolia]|uniref:Unnamed protein product n=1 Tax=Phytophthora fragariaefolia TaxID=1490495 RepID=A0A9W6UFF3_9STRA|nr:unnamed protein product [Phytophthora fragariaefolia]